MAPRKWSKSHKPGQRPSRESRDSHDPHNAHDNVSPCGNDFGDDLEFNDTDSAPRDYFPDQHATFIASWLSRSTHQRLSLDFMGPEHFDRCLQIQQDEFTRDGWKLLSAEDLQTLRVRPQITSMVAKITGWEPGSKVFPVFGGHAREHVVGWVSAMMVIPTPSAPPVTPAAPATDERLPESMLYIYRLCVSRDLTDEAFSNVALMMISNVVSSARVMGFDKVRIPMGWWQTDLIKILQTFGFVHDTQTIIVRATTTKGPGGSGTSFEETSDGEVFVFVLDTKDPPAGWATGTAGDSEGPRR